MNSPFSRMNAIQSPIIPVVGELIKNSPGTISLGQGVVHYSPPPEAIELLPKFLAEPKNHLYKAVVGIPELLTVLTAKLSKFNGIDINGENCIVVTAGSNMGFMNAVLAITSPGDEIILNTPYYFNHEMAIKMAGCHPVLVETDENYQLVPEGIAQAITSKTRAVVTISPNNPTGIVYPKKLLYQVNEICRERGIYHISDEAYEYFTYDGVKHLSPGAFPGSSEYTISLYSLSKAYGFASWRIGYMVIPQHLLNAVKKVQDTILICPPVVSQYAAVGALQAKDDYLRDNISAIAQVRQLVLNTLRQLQGLCTVTPADGAFYFFLKVHTQMDAFELVKRLIQEHQVAVIPGTTFGMKDGCYLRVAYGALRQETAKVGIERLVKGIKSIIS
ncbi:pyridoxal phosphate-dependent aminotransferase [Anabaena cylindrica FACHB-243]|uniref:Aspartate transaminase n=1 Tax=Anabaena cylindrica (strain ATCC 27899 / PCC 7122) TaxID=272123 RepID=K9ZGL6_ANACC|nr:MULTISPECIES: pyridoxal phosphate-dependent aminotransferase [Anabaena]AFZ58326.1 Aspartate transaminase [Anabaena cylindrica PCC 7122]MBD2416919.1 pyridoxal phosphate-dependent aminotransferase [Anabaena cylindrica FACHB-243]MBY5281791.1 pyridoxal phosphate-dependent aminotransferase [Anabaena sp. CCAP 1446/1C]MBY5310119.1 pyridoxal phosphate-dependent aminotransferase [Anabaena sp. CCAP 1446/1C]MCM2406451.1 pyridoxal phosphate-dependent aminotransferase [Anabaena sp. CCAP 1446/1C]